MKNLAIFSMKCKHQTEQKHLTKDYALYMPRCIQGHGKLLWETCEFRSQTQDYQT